MTSSNQARLVLAVAFQFMLNTYIVSRPLVLKIDTSRDDGKMRHETSVISGCLEQVSPVSKVREDLIVTHTNEHVDFMLVAFMIDKTVGGHFSHFREEHLDLVIAERF